MWKHKYLLSTLEPSVEYFRFKAGLFNPNPIREALTSLRGKIDDLWIMIIPDWLRSGFGKFGDVLHRVYFIAWVSVVAILYWTFQGSEHCSKQLIIWLPQNIYCGIPSRSRQKFWAPMLVIPHKVHNISRILAKTVFLCDLILGWEMEF